jgi:hypothetical protein
MNQCQNCGQVNNYGSNFCRFCGSRIVMVGNQNQDPATYEQKPPRPYVWKTDEFQVQENQTRKTQQIRQVQPLANMTPPQSYAPQAMTQYQTPMMNYGYRCPNCGTQHYPRIIKKISPAGWIVFAVLLVMFFPLFWIGFLIKEDVKMCSICNMRVG